MKRFFAYLVVLTSCALLLSGAGTSQTSAQGPAPIRGFAASRVAGERELEQKFLRIPKPESAEHFLRIITSEPHMAGTEGSRKVAEYIRDRLRASGFETELIRYQAWMPYPTEVKLELVAPEAKPLATQEDIVEEDKDTYNPRAVIGFNSYSPSGELTAPVVYANYGMPEDYRRLKEMGISVEGKVVLTRYGGGFRGVKTEVAEENKAAGVIIFSDPGDDGYVAGDPYPRGPWRPMSGIQRGSILYTFLSPGDPLTPGTPSIEQTQRIEPAQAKSMPRIPTMPINARDAAEILKHLRGPRVPREWQGGLPLSYHVGPGDAVVHMKIAMDYRQRTLYDVVGKLRGTNDDEWVVLGNHHDAWVFGAVDPSSGTATMLETARSLGELAKNGWKPRRTIVFCAWDGEEFGLLGSTEWVEDHIAEVQRKAVAYINMDTAVSGPNFSASATPSLKEFIREVTRDVADPRTGRSVYDAWKERLERQQQRTNSRREGQTAERDVPLGSLGSGSDFTPFFHHAGIPSLDIGSGGEYGVYHSRYDDFYWMKTFGDPDFAYHATMARIAGLMVMRLAGADVLPFDYEAYAAEVQRYVGELEATARASGEGKLDLTRVREATALFQASAYRAQRTMEVVSADPTRWNRAMVLVEQDLLSPQGLAGRPWYRHTIFAPGTYAGYAAVMLPGIREAVDRGDWETARREAAALAEALHRASARLDEIAGKPST